MQKKEGINDLEDRITEIIHLEQQTERQIQKKKKKWKQYMRPMGKYKACQFMHKKPRRRRKIKWDWKSIWRNYGWKFPKPKKEIDI